MSAIAQSVFMYANNNHTQLPPDLQTLAVEEDITPAAFVCGGSTDRAATSPKGLSAPGHLSYFYARPNQSLDDVKNAASTVMLYEQPNHFRGMNVAFYDGHVEFVPRRKAAKAFAELRAGLNPPPSLNGP